MEKDLKAHTELLMQAIERMREAERRYVSAANLHGMGSREEIAALNGMEGTRAAAGTACAEAAGFIRVFINDDRK